MDRSEVTHYEVLGISRDVLHEAKDAQLLIRHAYRRALLRHHPDKTAVPPPARCAPPSSSPSSTQPSFTIDQITVASAVLSDPRRRREYDAALSLARASSPSGRGFGAHNQQHADFQTGIETLDLDDLDFDDERGVWYRACRCGNHRGFELAEEDLEPVADHGELIVGCQDCSLWLKVNFAVVLQDIDGGSREGQASAAP